MTDLLLRLVEHVRRERLFPHPGGAVVAVSGGSDSVALLDLVNSARQEFGLDLSIGHVDHGTGTTADAARSVERLADRFKLPIHQLSLNLGPDWTETGARNGRYELLLGLLEDVGGRYIVMGHHADDQIETVLMRFLKGSGPAGLAGIGHRSGPVVRPLLPFRKRELADWVAARGLRDLVCEDPSNLDERHLRNWIRNTVLPVLGGRDDLDLRAAVDQLVNNAGADRKAWAAALRYPGFGFQSPKRGADGCEFDREALTGMDPELCAALLRAASRETGFHLGVAAAERAAAFLQTGTSGHSIDVGSGWSVEIAFDKAHLKRASSDEEIAEVALASDGGSLEWGRWQFSWRSGPAGTVDRRSNTTWMVPGPGRFRCLRPGDTIQPLGGVGTRKARRELMEAKVPRDLRWRYPILARGSDIVWIPGVCRSSIGVPSPGDLAIRIDFHENRDV